MTLLWRHPPHRRVSSLPGFGIMNMNGMAGQGKAGEAEEPLDGAEDRFDSLLAKLVESAALFAGEPSGHRLEPSRPGLFLRRPDPGRAEVVRLQQNPTGLPVAAS